MEEEKEIYCFECGEDEDIAYLRTCANGDLWKCRVCRTEFSS